MVDYFAARADDTEALFVPPNVVVGDAPNILFVIDSSSTMGTPAGEEETPPQPPPSYSSATDYTALAAGAGCVRDRIYYQVENPDPNKPAPPRPQSCAGLPWIQTNLADVENTSANKLSCRALQDYFLDPGNNGATVLAQVAQYDSSKKTWRALDPSQSGLTMDCFTDQPVHGINSASAARYIAKSKFADANGDTGTPGNKNSNVGAFPSGSYLFLSGNAVAYVTDPLTDTLEMVGSGSVDLWLQSTAPDTDLQVTLSEDMLILEIESPEGEKHFLAAAFPSACGKTNLAMLIPPDSLAGWKVRTLGDDIAWLHMDEAGQLRAINPESGYFGVVPGTNQKTNRNAFDMIQHDTIFTNVALNSQNEPWWEDKDKQEPTTDWRGKPWKKGNGAAAHPNSRFTVSARQNPSYSPLLMTRPACRSAPSFSAGADADSRSGAFEPPCGAVGREPSRDTCQLGSGSLAKPHEIPNRLSILDTGKLLQQAQCNLYGCRRRRRCDEETISDDRSINNERAKLR